MYNGKIKIRKKRGYLTMLNLKTHDSCHWIGSATNRKATKPSLE